MNDLEQVKGIERNNDDPLHSLVSCELPVSLKNTPLEKKIRLSVIILQKFYLGQYYYLLTNLFFSKLLFTQRKAEPETHVPVHCEVYLQPKKEKIEN